MTIRGEGGLIFAGIGKGIAVIDDGLGSAVVSLVMIAALLPPIRLRHAFGQNSLRQLRAEMPRLVHSYYCVTRLASG